MPNPCHSLLHLRKPLLQREDPHCVILLLWSPLPLPQALPSLAGSGFGNTKSKKVQAGCVPPGHIPITCFNRGRRQLREKQMSSQGVTVFVWLTCWGGGRGCSHNVTWVVTLDQSCCLWPQGTGHARAWWLLLNGTLVTHVCPLLGSGERIMGGEEGGMRYWE